MISPTLFASFNLSDRVLNRSLFEDNVRFVLEDELSEESSCDMLEESLCRVVRGAVVVVLRVPRVDFEVSLSSDRSAVSRTAGLRFSFPPVFPFVSESLLSLFGSSFDI